MMEETQQSTTITPEVVNANELEAKLLADSVQNANHKPEDIAAAFFTKNYRALQQLVNNMSLNALIRGTLAVAAYPLMKDYTPKKGSDEARFAYMFNEMIENKVMMRMAMEIERAEQELLKEKQEGENNGEVQT